MKKVTILAILVIAGTVASIVACGDSAPANNPNNTTTTTSSGAASGSAAPAAS
jgi:hypothetical protein